MYDVAKHAGVSQTTLAGAEQRRQPWHSRKTTQRIWTAVTELGYRPNALTTGWPPIVRTRSGFITDNIATTPDAGKIIEGAQEPPPGPRDNLPLLVNTQERADVTQAAIEVMLTNKVEGIIYATMYHRSVQLPGIFHDLPAVLLIATPTTAACPRWSPTRSLAVVAQPMCCCGRPSPNWFFNHADPVPAMFGRWRAISRRWLITDRL